MIEFIKGIQYVFALSVLYLISYDTIKCVSVIICKNPNSTLDNICAALALCVCMYTTMKTLLQMLLIFKAGNGKKAVIIHHVMGDEPKPTEESKESKKSEESKNDIEEEEIKEESSSTEDDKAFDEIK